MMVVYIAFAALVLMPAVVWIYRWFSSRYEGY